jgi:hypothetical protein
METEARIRPGFQSRYQKADPRKHPEKDHYRPEDRDRPTRTPGGDERDEYPERQHVPFLSVWVPDMFNEALAMSRDSAVDVEVANNGNAASFTPIVELFLQREQMGLWRGGMTQLPPAYPHTTVRGTVKFSWSSLKPLGNSPLLSITAAERFQWVGYLTAVCYDPSLDPKPAFPFDPWPQPAHNRKILTIPYWSSVVGNP